jgi:tetratricopeptide (TPR) repeat protein
MHLAAPELDSLVTEVPPATLAHLVTCPRCRRRLADILFVPIKFPEQAGRSRLAETVVANAIARVTDEPPAIELQRAADLQSVLMAIPQDQRLEAIERQPAFHSPTLAEVLLLVAADAQEDPVLSRDLAGLADAILSRLNDSTQKRELLAQAACLLTEAARRQGKLDLAEEFFNESRLHLRDHPLVHPLRARLSLTAAALRHDQRRTDEAIALLNRAVDIADELHLEGDLAEAHLALGQLYLEEDEPDASLLPLREAMELLDSADLAPRLLALEALGLACTELGDDTGTDEILRELGALESEFPSSIDPIRTLWIRARIEARKTDGGDSLAMLRSVFDRLVDHGPGYLATLAALELAELLTDLEPEANASRLINASLARLVALPGERLAPHLLAAVRFALTLASKRKGAYMDALLSAEHWLERARFNPDLPYWPIPEPDDVVTWASLSGDQRSRLVQEALEPDAAGRLSSLSTFGLLAQLTRADFNLLAWTHEALTGIRIQPPTYDFDDTPPG